MENATKALAIAGSVLLALMVIAVLLYMVQNIGASRAAQEEQKIQEQIIEFNKEYESYEKTLMRGTDVVTIINKANNNNLKRAYDANGNEIKKLLITTHITLKCGDITDKEGNTVLMNNKEYVIGNYGDVKNKYNVNSGDTGDYDAMIQDSTALTQFKRRFFRCKVSGYNNETGYVNDITFEEVDVNEDTKHY